MKTKILTMAVALACVVLTSRTEASDGLPDAIRKAGQIVTAEVVDAPEKRWTLGKITTYTLHVKVLEVVKGELSNTEMYAVFNTADLHRFPYLKKGGKCIVFLQKPKNAGKYPGMAIPITMPEPWRIFCIQPYSPAKIAAIERVR